MKIKLFADGADLKGMVNEYEKGIVKGFTTNPTLMRKAGVTNYPKFAKEVIKEIPDFPISFEVFTDDPKEMVTQARIISSWGENVYVKIPVTDTKGNSTNPVIKELSEDGIKVNVTAVMTRYQVYYGKEGILANLSKKTPAVISVFAGRIADTGRDPRPTVSEISTLIKTSHPKCECLWASTREVLNVYQAELCGCDIITVPNDILAKLTMKGKDLKQLSLDTVKMFYTDAKEAGYVIE